jgi:LysM repeat protein
MLLGAFALVLGVFLLFSTPTLPHENERTAGAPKPTVVDQQGARPAPAPAQTAPGTMPAPSASPAVAAPSASASPEAARRHTIQPGDTLLAIAEQYDTTVDAIRAANPGLNENALQVGAEIVIPASR